MFASINATVRDRPQKDSPPHDVNRQNASLVTGQQIINEIADNRVWFVTELGDNAADQCAAATMPLQINRAVQITRAMDFRPTMRTTGLLCPDFDEVELFLQLRIAHDLRAERTMPSGDDLDERLQLSLGSADFAGFATLCFARR